MRMRRASKIIEAGENIFAALGFPPEEANLLHMRAELMNNLRATIEKKHWTQSVAAKHLGISQSRVSDLVRGKWDKFSLEMLITLVSRSGQQITLAVA
jgi:predicted XRE-type DNA-binding protein